MQNIKTFYFDSAATTPIDLDVIELMHEINLNYFGNPSSIHQQGQKSHNIIEKSRKSIAQLLRCNDSEILFTSGGSESNNIVLKGALNPGDHFITSSYEHPSIIKLIDELKSKQISVTIIKPNIEGIIESDMVLSEIRENTKLVSIMYVNNELGSINPIHEIGRELRKQKIYFHSDAVQYAGKGDLDLSALNIDLLSLGAHKFYGPKGIGLLYIKKGIVLNPLISGGGQENGMRAGTENISAIAGMELALKIAHTNLKENHDQIKLFEDHLLKKLIESNIDFRINGESHRINGILNITFFGVDGHALLINLDMLNIAISYGSACSSGSTSVPKTLLEIDMPEDEAKNTVRISIGKTVDIGDIDFLAKSIITTIGRIKR